MSGPLRFWRVVTSGTFSLDGQTFDVDNNVWLIGDDTEVIVIDAAHDAEAIAAAVGERRVLAIVCTHAHDDHIDAAPALADLVSAPVLLHPDDRVLWDLTHPDRAPDGRLAHGDVLRVAGVPVHVLHTPGHAPGAICLYVPDLDLLFSGDTLFAGGPGATGRSYSDFPTIIDSLRRRVLTLPPGTDVLPGHGDATTVGRELVDVEAWVARGH